MIGSEINVAVGFLRAQRELLQSGLSFAAGGQKDDVAEAASAMLVCRPEGLRRGDAPVTELRCEVRASGRACRALWFKQIAGKLRQSIADW